MKCDLAEIKVKKVKLFRENGTVPVEMYDIRSIYSEGMSAHCCGRYSECEVEEVRRWLHILVDKMMDEIADIESGLCEPLTETKEENNAG